MTNEEMKRYYRTGKPFVPKKGEIYENLNGASYKCTDILNYGVYQMTSQTGQGPYWTCAVTGLMIYEDNRIDWAHSSNGTFTNKEGK